MSVLFLKKNRGSVFTSRKDKLLFHGMVSVLWSNLVHIGLLGFSKSTLVHTGPLESIWVQMGSLGSTWFHFGYLGLSW